MKKNTIKLTNRFLEAFKPLDSLKTTELFTELALKELRNQSKPPTERYKSAIRLLSCIPAIGELLPDSTMKEIFSKQGIDL